MFSRRHYIAIAQALRVAKTQNLTTPEFEEKLISLFKCDNEKFSSEKFRKASA
jgi:hypothetical protein